MRAFVTGGRVYGEPKEDSDIDLVVFVPSSCDRELLRSMSDNRKLPIRFGRLNLIICETEAQWLAWKVGTEIMRLESKNNHRVYDKETATDLLNEYREALCVIPSQDSGVDDEEEEVNKSPKSQKKRHA